MNKLRLIDLNLLVTLQALLAERHISRTAVRLHKSQPAVSHALARLRELFNDPLLIRRSSRLELTAKASELVQPLNLALDQIASLLDVQSFDPSSEERIFRLAMSDYGSRVLLPDLVRTLRQVAPGVELAISQAGREAMQANVIDGEIDLALGVFPGQSREQLRVHTLFVERFACLADRATLSEDGTLDLPSWLKRPHVLVGMQTEADNEIDRALGRRGLERNLSVVLPHWGVADELIAGTDLILTVARRSLDRIGRDARLCVFDPPFPLKPFEFKLIWHQRRDTDPAHIWLRQMIMQAFDG